MEKAVRSGAMPLSKFLEVVSIEIVGTTERLQRLHYIIKVSAGPSWDVTKSYPELVEFRKSLTQRTPFVPALDELLIIELKKELVSARQNKVEEFLHEIVVREDIVLTDEFRQFFNLPFVVVGRSCSELALVEGIGKNRSVALAVSDNVLFHLLAKDSITNSFGNFLGTFLSALKPSDAQGYLVAYSIEEKSPFLVRLWDELFASTPVCMAFDKGLCLLGVGLADGQIQLLQVDVAKGCSSFHSYSKFKLHRKPVVSLKFNSKQGLLYSCSTDKTIVTKSVNLDRKLERTVVMAYETTALTYLSKRGLCLVGDVKGGVCLLALEDSGALYKSGGIDSKFKQPIRALQCSQNEKYLYCLTPEALLIFDLLQQGREKYASIYSVLEVPLQASVFRVLLKESEVLFNYRNNLLVMTTTGSMRQSHHFFQTPLQSLQLFAGSFLIVASEGHLKLLEYKEGALSTAISQVRQRKEVPVETSKPKLTASKPQWSPPIQVEKELTKPTKFEEEEEEEDLRGWDR